jgi:MFS transporter, PAT family, beta-lactamase induction signal transducer AmpG
VRGGDPVYPAPVTEPSVSRRVAALASPRVHLLAFLSVSSGMPLAWVYTTFQIFLIDKQVDKPTLAVVSGISVAWTIKFLWSPLVDRYALPWPGRRRSWIILAQLALAATFVALAVFAWRIAGSSPLLGRGLLLATALGFAVAFFSATQDIALDAYAVEALHPEEREPASGLRIFWYRAGMLLAGGVVVSLSDVLSWPVLFLALGACFAGFVLVTLALPEPEHPAAAPRSLATAVVEPLHQFFRRPDAIGIGLFLVFYKFGDNMGGTMVNYFLKDLCFRNAEIGLLLKTVGTVATILGSLGGAALMMWLGLGRSLWGFGVLQAGANLIYSAAALSRRAPLDLVQCAALPPVDWGTRAWAYGAIAGEYAAQGMATAAQAVLLLRVCDKRYSATQFALLTSLFALGRWAAGLPSGWLAARMGYPLFFAACATLFALPGFVFLQRLAPFGARDVTAAEAAPNPGPPA